MIFLSAKEREIKCLLYLMLFVSDSVFLLRCVSLAGDNWWLSKSPSVLPFMSVLRVLCKFIKGNPCRIADSTPDN